MDEHTKKLIALGASAAANCRPCLEYHLGQARASGIPEEDIATAIEIGLGVNEGAARKTREFATGTCSSGTSPRSGTPRSGCC